MKQYRRPSIKSWNYEDIKGCCTVTDLKGINFSFNISDLTTSVWLPCLRFFRHEYLYGVRGCITGRLGVPHVQSHWQLPAMALLLLLHNAHFLLGVACQGKNPVTFSHFLTFLSHLCFIASICFIFHRMCSLPSSSRRLPRSEYSFSRCGGQGAAPPRLLQHRYSCHNHSDAKAPTFKDLEGWAGFLKG